MGAVAELQKWTDGERVETSTGKAMKVGVDLDAGDVLVAEPAGKQGRGGRCPSPALARSRHRAGRGLARADENVGRWRGRNRFLANPHVEFGQHGHQRATGVHTRQVRGGTRRRAPPGGPAASLVVEVRHEVVARSGGRGVTPSVVALHNLSDHTVDERDRVPVRLRATGYAVRPHGPTPSRRILPCSPEPVDTAIDTSQARPGGRAD
jgi:hypothetical protein